MPLMTSLASLARRTLPLLAALALLPHSPASLAAPTETWEDRPSLARHFDAAGVKGSIVVLNEADGRWTAHDSQRAHVRYLPASTFKIPNTLIALETGVARDLQQRWQWDGTQRWLADWNRDQTLASAYRVSAVWVYQDIARQIGAERMRRYLRDFRYGNAESGPLLERFWLDGDLRISAVEQVDFLRRLNAGSLPLSARTLALAREVMLREDGPDGRLYAKTGWADSPKPAIGWFVGWLEKSGGDKVYFALNIDMPEGMPQAAKREAVTRAVLTELGHLR